jgi:hypothetical protein
MRRRTKVLLGLLGLATTGALGASLVGAWVVAARRTSERVWRARAAQVQVGMPRAMVEMLLPRWGGSSGTLGMGSVQVTSYFVDPRWEVSVAYDYEGSTPAMREGAENRVLAAPTLAAGRAPAEIELSSPRSLLDRLLDR